MRRSYREEEPGMMAIRERISRRGRHPEDDDEEEEDEHEEVTETILPAEETNVVPNQSVPWTEVLRILLCGTRDEGSACSLLRGHEETVLREIYALVVTTWKDAITLTTPAHSIGRIPDFYRTQEEEEQEGNDEQVLDSIERRGRVVPMVSVSFQAHYNFTVIGRAVTDRPKIAFSPCGFVDFPTPENRNVNMLPFVLGDIDSLPDTLRPYFPIISDCPVIEEEEVGKVCYLTVQEGFVDASETQRRSGLHIEAPGKSSNSNFVAGYEHQWGCGVAFSPDELHGGLFIASSMPNTTAIWNALVDTSSGCVNNHGGMESLRPFLGEPTKLQAHELVWLTDRTPHEAIPQTQSGYRQFFRLVTSKISVWFQEHSTPNPKVPLPDFVQVIEDSKFKTVPSKEND